MKDKLFDTEKKREAAIATFRMGMGSPFWQLMTQILEANIEVVTERILEGDEEATKEQMDRLRDKLRVYKEIIKTPETMIEKLTGSVGEDPGLDPYFTEKQLEEENKKVDKGA